MSGGRFALIVIAGLIGWFVYFIYSKNQEATAYIEGSDCPVITTRQAAAEGAVFPRVIYDDEPQDHDIYVVVQNDVAGTFSCFTSMNDTRCNVAGPGLFRAQQVDKTEVYRISDGEVAVVQGGADDLYCTIPDNPSDADQ